METLIHPFSFREALRHVGAEPDQPSSAWPKALCTDVDRRLREYLTVGGYPEAQGVAMRDRSELLRTYVDVVILRDVIERHCVSNSLPLRSLQRHLLTNPGAPFSVQKFYDSLRSQGIAVGKDTLHTLLSYLEDTFLVHVIALHTASERQRMIHPRKVYPVDPGLIPVYERSGRLNLRHALETAVLIELERRSCEVSHVGTREGARSRFPGALPDGSMDARAGMRRSDGCRRLETGKCAYFLAGGQEMQINRADTAELRAAQAHPERYRDLVVRVAGFSAFFVNLTKDMQDEIIAHTRLSPCREKPT